ncbi:Lymphocyte cytosolic protein 2 [Vespula squamosa]|uniref:Lymphocyte cytosolic protein 2 n=1 Tax=Vespula squamosa TaxID=30214 RepID=A0ABD2AXP3_VESSQ
MCSCFYLRLSKHLLGGLGERLADEVSDMIVRIKRGLSRCCYSQPPDPPVIESIESGTIVRLTNKYSR